MLNTIIINNILNLDNKTLAMLFNVSILFNVSNKQTDKTTYIQTTTYMYTHKQTPHDKPTYFIWLLYESCGIQLSSLTYIYRGRPESGYKKKERQNWEWGRNGKDHQRMKTYRTYVRIHKEKTLNKRNERMIRKIELKVWYGVCGLMAAVDIGVTWRTDKKSVCVRKTEEL